MDQGRTAKLHREAAVRIGDDGLPLVEFAEPRLVSGAEALAVLRAYRDER